MKKTLYMVALAALSLAALVAPVSAVPASDLTALAEYFPPDTPVFFSVRTDAAFLDELDSLIETARGNLPPGTMPPFSLRQALNASLTEQFGEGATFESTFGWLGDSAAFGITSFDVAFDDDWTNDDQMPALLAIAVSDAETAEAMVLAAYEDAGTDVERERDGDWVLLRPETPTNAFWALNDEVALVATTPELLPLSDDRRSLADNEDFNTSVASLPASDYSAIAALDLGDVMRASYATMLQSADDEPGVEMLRSLKALYENYPRQIAGFTILDDRTLTIDFAQSAFNFDALEGQWFGGVASLLNAEPVEAAFAEHIPADAPFVYMGTNLGASIDYAIDVFAQMGALGIQMDQLDNDEDTPAFVEDIDARDLRAFVDLAVSGMTGLNLERDVLPYLNGNVALYGRIVPFGDDDLTFDGAVVVEVTDRAATRHMLNSLVEALTLYEADFSEEDGVLVLPGLIRGLLPSDTPGSVLQAAEFDFLIGVTDDVIAAGTRNAVEHSIAPAAESLADDPDFQSAQAQFLPGAQSVGYIGFGPLREMLETAARMSGAMEDSEVAFSLAALQVLESAALSSTVSEDGNSVVRMTLTLAE